MNTKSRPAVAVLLAGVWVNASEFFRNEVLFKSYWVDHYRAMGLTFPSEPINGIVWMLWGFVFALVIYLVSRKFGLLQTTLLCWLTGFVLMWLVAGNLGVLPSGLLVFAVPLSLLECGVGAYLCNRFAPLP